MGQASAACDISISYGGLERIDDVRDLWLSLFEHHKRVSGHIAPVKTREESWALRRACYERWLQEPDACLCIAEATGKPVGYAMLHWRDADHTFASEERMALIETISVAPDVQGLGAAAAIANGLRAKGYELGVYQGRASHLVGNDIAGEFFKAMGGVPLAITYRIPIEPPEKL